MALKLAAVFSDHMVVRRTRGPGVRLGGAGRRVSVAMAGHAARAVVGEDGRWLARLPRMDAGGPFDLTVSGAQTVVLKDVMVGEVWLCSGQSNMEWPVATSNNGVQETAAADYPNIRLFSVPRKAELPPATDVVGAWSRCTPETIGLFSAVAISSAAKIHRKTGPPSA